MSAGRRLMVAEGSAEDEHWSCGNPQSTNRPKSCLGSHPIALAISMNSMTSTRRSPASIRPTKEFGRRMRAARSRWVIPAFARAATSASINLRCPRVRSVFRSTAVLAMTPCSGKWSAIDKRAVCLLA